MISDTERRDVARRLREKKAECEERGYPWMCDDLILALGYDHDYEAGDEIFDRLADLIEPEPERTCRVECYPPGYEDNLHYEVCSECGAILMAMRPGDRHSKRANYCPSCGARVIYE